MSDQSQADRLAALAAMRAPAGKQPGPTPGPTPTKADSAPSVGRPRTVRLATPSPTRLVATGASLVSFAAMVVAMGPLTADAGENSGSEPAAGDLSQPIDL